MLIVYLRPPLVAAVERHGRWATLARPPAARQTVADRVCAW